MSKSSRSRGIGKSNLINGFYVLYHPRHGYLKSTEPNIGFSNDMDFVIRFQSMPKLRAFESDKGLVGFDAYRATVLSAIFSLDAGRLKEEICSWQIKRVER